MRSKRLLKNLNSVYLTLDASGSWGWSELLVRAGSDGVGLSHVQAENDRDGQRSKCLYAIPVGGTQTGVHAGHSLLYIAIHR